MRTVVRYAIPVFLIFFMFTIMAGSLWAVLEEDDLAGIEEVLAEGSVVEQMNALQQIQKSGLPLETINELVAPVLEHDDVRIRLLAVRILYENGDSHSVEAVFAELERADIERNIKLRILNMIKSFGDEELIYRLGALINQEKDVIVKLALIDVFLNFFSFYAADENISGLLRTYLKTGSELEKIRVLDILKGHGEEIVPLLKLALEDESLLIVDRAFESLVGVSSNLAKDVIRLYIKDANKEMVYRAAYALARLGEDNYLRLIKNDLHHEDSDMRTRALMFLYHRIGHGHEEYFQSTIEKMARADENEAVRNTAEQYLKQITRMARILSLKAEV